MLSALLIAACAEGPAGTFFEGQDSSIETPPIDPDAGMPNVEPPGEPGAGGTTGGIPPFPIPTQDASSPPVMMPMDASRPPMTMDAGHDSGTPPAPVDAARPPAPVDAAADVVAPPPDTGTPMPNPNMCASTPAFATPDACTKCICMRCATQVASCYASGETAKDQQCKLVRDCALQNRCTGQTCYCGGDLLCLSEGPCRQVIDTAAAPATDVTAASNDLTNPVGRSNAVGTCSVSSCASECGLQ